MFKFIVLVLNFSISIKAFNFEEFQRKYCYDDTEIRSTIYYFPYEVGYSKTYPEGYVCENFVLTKEDLNSIAMADFTLSKHGTVLLKNCVLEYFNEHFVSKFPNLWALFLEDCQFSLKNSEIQNNFSVSKNFNMLGFHGCHIYENANSLALQKFNELTYLIIQNSTFQYPRIDEHFLPRPNNFYDILIDNVNVHSIHKGLLSSSSHSFDIISCTSCQLQEIDSLFYHMRNEVSKRILFSDNLIRKLPSSLDVFANKNTTLEINLSGNLIEESLLKRIHFKALKNLKILNLSRNKLIKSMGYSIFKDTFLQTLNMSRVNLEVLDTLGNSNLTVVDFSFNNIKKVPKFVFEKLFNLKFLNLSNNQISKLEGAVFQELRSLKELRLSFNQLKSLPKSIFNGVRSLEVLDLSNNFLTIIDGLETLKHLKELNLHNNSLKIVSSGKSLPNSLRIVDVSQNSLTFIGRNTFSNLDKLDLLDISYTNSFYIDFDETSFEPLKALKVLKLKGNKIRTLEEIHLPKSLKELDLGYNRISKMTNKGLGELIHLEYLDLSNNLIHDIEKDLLRKMLQIKHVDLSGNEIMYNNFKSMFFNGNN